MRFPLVSSFVTSQNGNLAYGSASVKRIRSEVGLEVFFGGELKGRGVDGNVIDALRWETAV